MPPKRAKAKASTSSMDAIPAPQITEPAHTTPEQSPRKKNVGITQAQKQALIDNLQLEVTERARKLRAQYALQAQGLRSRLEMRINRIPQGLRKRKMQDLLDEHAEKTNPKPAEPIAVVHEDQQQEDEQPRGSLKRSSDQISSTEPDKENTQPSQDLTNPKKRAKTTNNAPAAKANTKATRTVSKKAAPLTVLSPKSQNSRTLPRSPFKPAGNSPEKPSATFVRPTSPVKPAPAAGRTASRQQTTAANKNAGAKGSETEVEGRSSETSNTSAGTTIVTKGTARGRATGAANKKAAATTAKAGGAGPKKTTVAAAKKENVQPVAAGGRSLRKRA